MKPRTDVPVKTLTPEEFLSELDAFSVGFLCTQISGAGLTARPMRLLKRLPDDGRIWFATRLDSPKIADLSACPGVCVTFQHGDRYAVLSGDAEVVLAPDKACDLWQESVRMWIPDGPRSEDFALVAVTPWSGELWDYSGVVRKLRFAIAAGRAYIKGESVPEEVLGHARMNLAGAGA